MDLQYLTFPTNVKFAPKKLVILLHGYGSNQQDLISIAPELSEGLPETYFISPNAPLPFEGMSGFAFQWFSLIDRSVAGMMQGARVAEKILNQFIDTLLAKYNLKPGDIALVGFSQGGMMALHTALRREEPLGAVICCSGMLLDPDSMTNEIKSRPKVMMIHGAEDEVITPALYQISCQRLKTLKVDCSGHLIPPVAHGIDRQGITLAAHFLADCLFKNDISSIGNK